MLSLVRSVTRITVDSVESKILPAINRSFTVRSAIFYTYGKSVITPESILSKISSGKDRSVSFSTGAVGYSAQN